MNASHTHGDLVSQLAEVARKVARETVTPTWATARHGSPCVVGCHACCYLPVEATWAEVALAWEAGVEAFGIGALATRVACANDLDPAGSIDERILARIACPLLRENGECAIYDSRPQFCRAYNAMFDAGACTRKIGAAPKTGDPNVVIVAHPAPFDRAISSQAAIRINEAHLGVSRVPIELTAGLSMIARGERIPRELTKVDLPS